jgi:IS30 family transposase
MKKAHLSREQRYTIYVMYKQGSTQKMIADAIGKDKSVICRELKRNTNDMGRYLFEYAQYMARLRKERMKKPRKLSPDLKTEIVGLLGQGWSPQQIWGRLKLKDRPAVSHETIYKLIRRDKAQGGVLYKHTRHQMRHRKRYNGGTIAIKDRISIDQRPAIVNARQRFGDWEIDTIVGKNRQGTIVTLVERQSAFMMMEKLPHGRNAAHLSRRVVDMLIAYINHVHSITGDNGLEFADHKSIARALKAQFFFTHPYCSWEKGIIENTNKLIRQYIPKKANFDDFSEKQIREIQYKINNRPRKKLNYYSPKEIFFLNLNPKVAFRC